MRPHSSLALAAAFFAAASLGAISSANAACKRMGFLVNDYGKDGPTKDAQALLEKDIAKWAASQGITNYKVDKRDVSCELFLNFIVFDEHTCTASATVCWDEKSAGKAAPQDAKADGTEGAAPKKAATDKTAAQKPADAKPTAKKEAAKPAAEKAAKVETGTVPSTTETPKAPVATEPVTEPVKEAAPAPSEKDSSQAAAAAAERAAAAAERAAIAAERAAQAAQDAQSQATPAAQPAAAADASASDSTAAPAAEGDATAKP